MPNQRVIVLTDEERERGVALLRVALGNGFMRAQLGGPVDTSLPEWLISLVEKFDAAGSALENPDTGRLDGVELIQWAESYGHPEWWCKKAQELHTKCERLEARLEHPEGITDELVEDARRRIGEIMAVAASEGCVTDEDRKVIDALLRKALEAALLPDKNLDKN